MIVIVNSLPLDLGRRMDADGMSWDTWNSRDLADDGDGESVGEIVDQ